MQTHAQRLRSRRLENPDTCFVCERTGHFPDLLRAAVVRPSLADHISKVRNVKWKADGRVCQQCLAAGRSEHLLDRLRTERGHLHALDEEVAKRIGARESVVQQEDAPANETLGARVADSVARVGGSWPFVLSFLGILVVWTAANTLLMHNRSFDPYPYILLNLVLSCVAALQAPIIMMSQNRSAIRDRKQAENDYRVNLKAEIEIAALHDKLDHVLHTQYEELIELQEAELDLLEQIAAAQRGS